MPDDPCDTTTRLAAAVMLVPVPTQKSALITGVTGQAGACLAQFLLYTGYEVHGIRRRASSFNTDRIDHLYQDPHELDPRFILHYGDLTDATNSTQIVQSVRPDEIYNLGAPSHVAVSCESPEYTANVDAMGALRLLEAIRILGLEKTMRYCQASTSELYGLVQQVPQTEATPFYPRSPYAVAKLYAYRISGNYREAFGIYRCNGILFNHGNPLRRETLVTRRITRSIARISEGLQDCLYLWKPRCAAQLGARERLRGDAMADAAAGFRERTMSLISRISRPSGVSSPRKSRATCSSPRRVLGAF